MTRVGHQHRGERAAVGYVVGRHAGVAGDTENRIFVYGVGRRAARAVVVRHRRRAANRDRGSGARLQQSVRDRVGEGVGAAETGSRRICHRPVRVQRGEPVRRLRDGNHPQLRERRVRIAVVRLQARRAGRGEGIGRVQRRRRGREERVARPGGRLCGRAPSATDRCADPSRPPGCRSAGRAGMRGHRPPDRRVDRAAR